MKTKKTILLKSGNIIPIGTNLLFANGTADFNGEQINLANLPYEACEYAMNEVLHPDIFEDYVMKDEVKDRLIAIANDFYASTNFKAPIIDIVLTGSMANYNYHDQSDLDVHILIDYAAENADTVLVQDAANALKWKWNTQHNITIAGHEVELYIQDVNEPHTASGIYSLLNNTWTVKPTFKTINTAESDVNAKVESITMAITDLQQRIETASNDQLPDLLNELDELRYKALHLRRDAFNEGEDEFSVGNLAFKELRNNGSIGLLLDMETKIYDKLNSL